MSARMPKEAMTRRPIPRFAPFGSNFGIIARPLLERNSKDMLKEAASCRNNEILV
jgi:hypothetical protein